MLVVVTLANKAAVAASAHDWPEATRQLIENGEKELLAANAPMLWEGMSPEKIEGLEGRLKDTSVPGVSAGLGDALSAALARWRKDPLETVAEISTNFLAGSAQTGAPGSAPRISQAEVARFYAAGEYTACRESLKPALPRLALPDSLLLAECAYDSGDFQTSFLASEQALGADAQSPAAWYWRIQASEVLAVNALIQADLAQPDSPSVHVMLGDVYREGRRYNEAEAEYRKAIELKPLEMSAHLGLAATFYRLFRYDEALSELTAVLQVEPQNPNASFMMADILAYQREFAQAEPYAKAALHGAQSNLPLVHALLGKIYASQGRTPEAIAELKRALPDDPDGSFHYQIARLYRQVGDEKAASEALRQSEILRKDKERKAQATIQAVK